MCSPGQLAYCQRITDAGHYENKPAAELAYGRLIQWLDYSSPRFQSEAATEHAFTRIQELDYGLGDCC
jgi:hypothetical protein